MRTVAALCRGLAADSRPDGQLLAACATEEAGAALTELVRRHGPLVWGTCRRLLRDPADAEDAFQAAFLVLVRRAGQLSRYPCVGPWLHRVTVLTARNVRRKNVRRLAKQTALPDHDHLPDAPAPDADLKADLDAALLALPSRYRDPIVLCHLLGFTRREAAERLGCPEGTLSGWLNRGLAKLRDRLRGLDPSKALAGGAVAVPAALCASTARAAVASTVAFASVNPTVSLLVEGVLRMFWVQKATAASVALCAVFALGVGIGLGTRTGYSGAAAQEKGAEKAPPGEKAKQPEKQATIAELEAMIRVTEAAHKAALDGVVVAKARLERLIAGKANPKDILDDQLTLARFQEDAEQAAAVLKDLEAKLAKLKAGEKPTAAQPAPDRAKQIQELEAELENLTLKQQLQLILATQQSKRVEGLKSANANATKLKEAEAALTEAQQRHAQTAAEIEAAKAKLALLKGNAKPEPTKPVTSVLDDLFGTPTEAETKLRAAQEVAERLQGQRRKAADRLAVAEAEGAPAAIEDAKAIVAKVQADIELATKNVQLSRSRLAASRAMHVPPLKALGACIEVVVVDGPAPGACRVREYGRGGVLVGSVLAEDAKALELILSRAMKDPAGPRDFWLVVSADHTPDAIVRAAKAGKAAGFTQVKLRGTVPDGLEATKAMSEREFNGAAFDLSKFAP